MKQTLLLHWHILRKQLARSYKIIRSEKVDLYIFLFSFICGTACNIMSFYFAFRGTGHFNGWNIYSALALLATYRLNRGIYGLWLNSGLKNMFTVIRSGDFDSYLTKPASAWFLISTAQIDLSRLVDIIASLILLIYALQFIPWTLASLGLYFLMVMIGLIIMCCCHILMSFTVFINLHHASLDFMEKLVQAATRYPLRFAHQTVQIGFTWFLPFMFISTIPVEMLEQRGWQVITITGGALISTFYIFLTKYCWQKAIKQYSSASS